MLDEITDCFFFDDYEGVIEFYNESILNGYEIEKSSEIYYYLGVSFLEVNSCQKAIKFFNKVLNNYNSDFTILSELNLIIAYYEMRNDNKAINYFLKFDFLKLISLNKSFLKKPIFLNIKIIHKLMNYIKINSLNSVFYDKKELLIAKINVQLKLFELYVYLKEKNYTLLDKLIDDILGIKGINEERKYFLENSFFYLVLFYVYKYKISSIKGNELNNYIKTIEFYFINIFSIEEIQEYYLYSDDFVKLIDILWKNKCYHFINEIAQRILKEVDYFSYDILFDFAYSSMYSNNISNSKIFYEKIIENFGESNAVCNNLAIIYKIEGKNTLSISFFKKAIKLDQKNVKFYINLSDVLILEKIYIDAIYYLRKAIKLDPNDDKIILLFKKIPLIFLEFYPNNNLSKIEQQELNELYWNSDFTIVEIKEYFNIPKSRKKYFSPLIYFYENCPNCDCELIYQNKTYRIQELILCSNCNHQHNSSYHCECTYCSNIRQQEYIKKLKIEKEKKQKELNQRIIKYSTKDYVNLAILKLSYKEKLFFNALYEEFSNGEKFTWEAVCNKANVVSHVKHINKLLSLSLVFIDLDEIYLINSSFNIEMLELKNIRNIKKSERFQVFQINKHTCQYCGRKPPEVELELDHIIPVSKGGNDNLENLITSCRDCNRGKSNKIIEGFNKDKINNEILLERNNILNEKRKRIEEVKEYWASCRNVNLSKYDEEFIDNFIEKYDPEWIKKAIKIATEKKPNNYAKYTAAILRNWAENGSSNNLSDLQLYEKKATENQLNYIKCLLEKKNANLKDLCGKEDLNELNMLDVNKIINILTDK